MTFTKEAAMPFGFPDDFVFISNVPVAPRLGEYGDTYALRDIVLRYRIGSRFGFDALVTRPAVTTDGEPIPDYQGVFVRQDAVEAAKGT